jgi:hypothetical protein
MVGVRRAFIVALVMGGFNVLGVSLASADTPGDNIPDLQQCPAMALMTLENHNGVVEIPCVQALKQSLDAVGFRNVEVGPYNPPVYTGLYDRTTWQDVWSFQTAHAADGLVATGNADPLTIQVLDRVANSNAALGDNGQHLAPPSAPKPKVYFEDGGSETGEMPDDCATSCGKEGGGEVEPPAPEPAPIVGP